MTAIVTLGKMIFQNRTQPSIPRASEHGDVVAPNVCRTRCPRCDGPLRDIRMKSVCEECHAICETCCEGGRG